MRDAKVDIETAKLAKEKGFDVLCDTITYFNEDGSSITETINYTEINIEYANLVRLLDKYPERTYSIPTQSLLNKWLRDVYKIHVNPFMVDFDYNKWSAEIINSEGKTEIYSFELLELNNNKLFETYEEALEVGLQEALKLIK